MKSLKNKTRRRGENMKKLKLSKKRRKEIEEMGDVVEIVKKMEISDKRDNESEKLLALIKEFPGSTQQELIIFLEMEEGKFRRALHWLEHKKEVICDDDDYVYPELGTTRRN